MQSNLSEPRHVSDFAPGVAAAAIVFGLDVYVDVPVPLLGKPQARPTGREVRLRVAPPHADYRGWPRDAKVICDERKPDGSANFRIETHPRAGYLIGGPEYGLHVLSPDGREIRCSRAGEWERLLIAQILPFAALLHGLEVFHASAVARGSEAVAILGPSGAGKTSVALELCCLGADFLADDVLALEVRDEGLLVHPGTQIAGLDHAEARRLERAGEPRREKVVAVNERERLLRMRGATEPAPLAALFFLDRRSDGPPSPRFEPVGDAQPLLGATFNFVLTTPERLRGLLDVCALAARLRVERIIAGPDVDATQLAGAVERRMDTSP
jgi:hypothetical protein